jgi:hypothetical protein
VIQEERNIPTLDKLLILIKQEKAEVGIKRFRE